MNCLQKRFPFLLFIPVLALLLALSGCTGPTGPDGNPGNAYVKITDSDGYLYSYSDDNSGTPSPVHTGVYYLTDPGVYDFGYEARIYYPDNTYDAADWSGTYAIHINAGDPGGPGRPFWRQGDQGADGPDSFLTLVCDYGGPTYYRLNKNTPQAPPKIGDVVSSTQTIGRYTFEITAKEKRFTTAPQDH